MLGITVDVNSTALFFWTSIDFLGNPKEQQDKLSAFKVSTFKTSNCQMLAAELQIASLWFGFCGLDVMIVTIVHNKGVKAISLPSE